MKIIITENKLERVATKWLNDNYGDLEPFESEKYLDRIFYRKDDTTIFYYNKENNVVFVNYEEIWSFLKSYFGLDTQQIQDLTKAWVEEHYNLRVSTTNFLGIDSRNRWRNITI